MNLKTAEISCIQAMAHCVKQVLQKNLGDIIQMWILE